MKDETYCQHAPPVELLPGNRPLVAPIYQSVKFELDDFDPARFFDPDIFIYSRQSNPTVRQLENLLAHLQKREDGLAVASGVAALSIPLLALLKAGDHVILFLESYKPTRYLVKELMAKFGVTHTLLSIDDIGCLEKYIQPQKTKLLMIESPTNPMTRVANLTELLKVTARHGVISLLDNTFAGFHQHGEYPFDLIVHSLTKFAGGHGDVMGGVILGSKKLITQIKKESTQIGPTLDPHTAYLILRGMKTYFVRYRQQSATALALAQWLEKNPQVEAVDYPGLDSHRDYRLAQTQMKDFGAILPFKLKGAANRAEVFLKRLKLFHIAGSVGSTDSLAAPALMFFGMDLSEKQREQVGLHPTSIRLSIGLEALEDLQADLAQALI